MSSSDIVYFRERAAVEHALARASQNANVAAIHDELARGYEALVKHEELRLPRPRAAAPEDARPLGLDGTIQPNAPEQRAGLAQAS